VNKTKNLENYFWLKFCENVEKSSSERTARILNSLLSVDEKGMIAKRLAAVKLIRLGKSYKEIGKILWMSPSTVSAIKKSMSNTTQQEINEEIRKKREAEDKYVR